MKIIFCDNTLWGLVNFRGEVIRHFMREGHQVVLVAPEKDDKQMRTTIPDGVRYIPVKMGRTSLNPIKDISYFMQMLKIYRKERPDYIFNYTIKPNIYGSIAARICGCHSTAMMAGLGYISSTTACCCALRAPYTASDFRSPTILSFSTRSYAIWWCRSASATRRR